MWFPLLFIFLGVYSPVGGTVYKNPCFWFSLWRICPKLQQYQGSSLVSHKKAVIVSLQPNQKILLLQCLCPANVIFDFPFLRDPLVPWLGFRGILKIPTCKTFCCFWQGRVSWFSLGKQSRREEFPGLIRWDPWQRSGPALAMAERHTRQPGKYPRQHSMLEVKLYDTCHWHSPLWKQKTAAGTAAVSQGYSSVSRVHGDALTLYLNEVVCRLKNCKMAGDFW